MSCMARLLNTLAVALLVSAVPAASQAQDWQRFGLKESKFNFEVPPGFTMTQRADNGQGAMFSGPDGAVLAVWGSDLDKRDFRSQIDSQMQQDAAEGWKLTYQRVTADWASYSGIKDGKIRYFRAISVCGDKAAVFLMDYDRSAKVPYDPIVVRMVRTLKADRC